jgi:hypothetical protein
MCLNVLGLFLLFSHLSGLHPQCGLPRMRQERLRFLRHFQPGTRLQALHLKVIEERLQL